MVEMNADAIVASGGVTLISSSGQVSNLASPATGIVVSAGEQLYVRAGGIAISSVILNSAFILNGGVTTGSLVSGLETVSSGGVVSASMVLEKANEGVMSGGTAVGTILAGSGASLDVAAGGIASGTTVGAHTIVYLGGSATGTMVTSGGILSLLGGPASGTIVSNGGMELGISTETGGTVLAGGTLTLTSGHAGAGKSIGETIASGGVENVDGTIASGTIVRSGGIENVSVDAIESGATLAAGATLNVGGSAYNITVAGTLNLLQSSAVVSGTLTLQGTATISAAALPTYGAGIQAVISGFGAGMVIDIAAISSSGATLRSAFDGSNTAVTVSSGGVSDSFVFAGAYTSGYFNLGADTASKATIVASGTPCYCLGTLIETAAGEVAVEDLAIGNLVRTVGGALRPIRWIGRRSYSGRSVAGNGQILPILIRAAALDGYLPRRDLMVSPLHAMLLEAAHGESVLVSAMHLVNGTSIVQVQDVRRIDYFHVELDTHDVILAEGAASETYVDDHSRAMFHNATEHASLYPEAYPTPARFYAPRVEDGLDLDTICTRIATLQGSVAARV